jgi:two-component sensor histidine kinase/ligand-binding sensor domain-containing protein
LLTNDLRVILQGRDGYIWIGSSAGLLRFDGVRFTAFNRRNTPQMPSDDVTSLVEDSLGTLWVSFLRGGVVSYADGRFFIPAYAESLSAVESYSLFFDGEGALCICTSRGLFRVEGGRSRYVEGIDGSARGGRCAPGGGYYVSGAGLFFCKGWNLVSRIGGRPAGEGYTSLCTDADGSLLTGTSTGLERLRFLPGGGVAAVEIARLRQVLSIIPYGPGKFLLGSLENGLQMLEGDRIVSLPGFEVLRGGGRQVRHIAVDNEGGIWATTPGGLYRFRRSFIRILGAESGIASEFSWTVRYTRDHALWVGAGDKGTYRITTAGARVFRVKDGMPSEYVSAIYEARDGSVWFGGMTGGLSVYRSGVLRTVDGYPGRGVFSIADDGSGGLLIGGGTGLYHYDGVRFSQEPAGGPEVGLAKIRTLVPAADGSLWMVASGRLYHRSGRRLLMYEAHSDRMLHQIMCIYVDTGRVWAGTYGAGLFLLQGDSLRQVRPRGFDPGPRILAVHEDARGYLWVNAERELQRVSKAELLRAAADSTTVVRVWVYDHQDGLSNLDFSHVSSSSSQQLASGNILYCSTNGIVVVNTTAEPGVHPPPPVYIEDIVADGVSHSVHDAPVLAPGTRRVEIRFAALQFDVPRRVRFRVKTTELDHDWVELDGLTRSVVYTSPAPGRYHFTVSASTVSGGGSTSEAAASFSVAPYLFETWWFRGGAGLLVAGVLLGGYVARMRTMRRRHAALSLEITQRRRAEEQLRTSLDEKTVMLKEIHHRVKNNLQVISSLLNLQAGKHRDEQLRKELQESQQRIRTMALIHERLYTSGNLARIGFKEYLDSLVGQLVRSMGTEAIGWTVEGDDVLLSIGQAIPAALIVNELVTNALKHAFPGGGGGEIVVRIGDHGESVTEFSVRDNGRGLPEGFNIHEVETLGMQLVATLTTQLDGEVAVERGQGVAFVVRFRRD